VTAISPPAVEKRATAPAGDRDRPRGHGQRLLEAIAALESFPALGYSRDRLLGLLDRETVSAHETVAVIESDPALAIGVLRLANRGRQPGARAICGIPDALSKLAPGSLRALAIELPVFDFFGQRGAWSTAAQHFRVHAVATVGVAERLIGAGIADRSDELRVGALLHDVGKLVVLHAYGRYSTGSEAPAAERVLGERRAWGLDHAVVGGVLARRLGLPNGLARLIERHHVQVDGSDAALLRLADLLVHYSAGHPVDQAELVAVAESCALAAGGLDALLYELPSAAAGARHIEPTPLTTRQTAVLRLLAHGKRYKQIAAELGLSPSTIRSHLHSAYRRLGVSDRAQAVLLATERGWIS
jgi:putative nucleotidyltransferase with HDIG domain